MKINSDRGSVSVCGSAVYRAGEAFNSFYMTAADKLSRYR